MALPLLSRGKALVGVVVERALASGPSFPAGAMPWGGQRGCFVSGGALVPVIS